MDIKSKKAETIKPITNKAYQISLDIPKKFLLKSHVSNDSRIVTKMPL